MNKQSPPSARHNQKAPQRLQRPFKIPSKWVTMLVSVVIAIATSIYIILNQ